MIKDLFGFIAAVVIAALLTPKIATLALKRGWLDFPAPRKIHDKPVARLGGIALFSAFWLVGLLTYFFTDVIDYLPKHFWAVFLGSTIVFLGGLWDDFRQLRPWQKFIIQLVAALVIVAGGLGISFLRLPFGLHIDLETMNIPIITFNGITYKLTLWSDLFTVFWIVLLINTINFLDGLDGLAAGITFIAATVLFFLSHSLGHPATAFLALVLSGAVFGFLPWNFHPAKMFMGDAGSQFLGFLLAVLSMISGGKIATAFLVLGVPVLDVGWSVIRRLARLQSPFRADRKHLHHRLLTVGLSQRQAVLTLYVISAAFGVVAVIGSTHGKVLASLWLLIVMVLLAGTVIMLEWRKGSR